MFVVPTAMIPMAVKEMHQRTKQQQCIRQKAKYMRLVFFPEKKASNRGKADKRQPASRAPPRMLFGIHITLRSSSAEIFSSGLELLFVDFASRVSLTQNFERRIRRPFSAFAEEPADSHDKTDDENHPEEKHHRHHPD